MKKTNFAPLYALWYIKLADIARENGYALAIHGSLGRDMDLILVAWTDEAQSAKSVIRQFCKELSCKAIKPISKPRNRMCYRLFFDIVNFKGAYLDISVKE